MLDLEIAFVTALMVWPVVMTLMVACQKTGLSRRLQYLADSSYWIYLMHYPLAMLVPALLRDWRAGPITKAICSTTLIYVVLLAIYERFIRYTAIGTGAER